MIGEKFRPKKTCDLVCIWKLLIIPTLNDIGNKKFNDRNCLDQSFFPGKEINSRRRLILPGVYIFSGKTWITEKNIRQESKTGCFFL
jgi:hypothetical protein